LKQLFSPVFFGVSSLKAASKHSFQEVCFSLCFSLIIGKLCLKTFFDCFRSLRFEFIIFKVFEVFEELTLKSFN
jgi:hypothetical protein